MNKVILIGRLTKDPELNFAAGSGTAVCKFTLAVTRPFKKDEVDFINCTAFGKTGETIAQYITKGKQLAVTGAIRTGSYDAKDGTKRHTTTVNVDSFEFIGTNSSGKEQNSNNNEYGSSGRSTKFGNGMNFDDDMTPVDDGDMPF